MKIIMNNMSNSALKKIQKRRFKDSNTINIIMERLYIKEIVIRCMMRDILFTNGLDIKIPDVSLGIDMFIDFHNLTVHYNSIEELVNKKLSTYEGKIKTKAYTADTIFQILLIEERRLYRINVLNKVQTPDTTGLQPSRRKSVQECINDFQIGNPNNLKTVEQIEKRLSELYKVIYDITNILGNTADHYGMDKDYLCTIGIYCIFKYFKRENSLYTIIDQQIYHWFYVDTLLVNPDEK